MGWTYAERNEPRGKAEQVELVPAAQWALTAAFRERFNSTPYPVTFDRAPRAALPTLPLSTGQGRQVGVLDEQALNDTQGKKLVLCRR